MYVDNGNGKNLIPSRTLPKNPSLPLVSTVPIRVQISKLAQAIRETICEQHVPFLNANTVSSGQSSLLDFRKPFYDTDGGRVESVVEDVADAFGVDPAALPDMTCNETVALAEKLFGVESVVPNLLRKQVWKKFWFPM